MLEFILPISLILPGLWIQQLIGPRFRANSKLELFSISYIFSLTIVLSLLFLGSITNAFYAASLVLLVIVIVSFVHLFLLLMIKVGHSIYTHKPSSFHRPPSAQLVVIISAIGLLSIYAVLLYSKAILDSDVVQEYLPIAREIVKGNGFTYSNGYDYSILLKPIGVSVLYAWAYVISGSTTAEAFRLMPLVPIISLIFLNYVIATSTTKSKIIGIISTAVFLVLPFNDRFLLYTAFYPDVFYYPLIFAVIYFLLEYFQSKRNYTLFFAGVALGLGSLLKAQTVFILISFMLVLIVLELRSLKKLVVVICCFAPFYILIPSILADSIQSTGFYLHIPTFTGTQVVLLFFLSMLSGTCFYVTMYRKASESKFHHSVINGLIRKIGLFLIPLAVLSSLWYVSNLFKFGTLISTSSINLPNYDWALGLLKTLQIAQPTTDVWHYLGYFMFVVVDPAVMGYIMLIPLLIGLYLTLKNRTENLNVLLLFEVISVVVILSTVTISLSSASGYNPRDIFVLAPFITTLSAVGIVALASRFGKVSENMKTVFVSLLLVAYFGLLNYSHSVLVWFTSAYDVTMIGVFTSSLDNIVGLNLAQTSFQLAYEERAIFIGDNISRIIMLSLLCGIPVLLYAASYHSRPLTAGTLHPKAKNRTRKLDFAKALVLVALLLSVIILPRAEMLLAQGGLQGIGERQLKGNFGAFYELVADRNSSLDGGMLTYKSPMGLAYYIRDIKILDLAYPANLAFLKDCLLSNSTYETVIKLRQQGIKYLLINPVIIKQFDASLNFTISRIIQNPELCSLSRTFGGWQLYSLGPYKVEKTLIPLSDWKIDPRYTNGSSYALSYNERDLSLVLQPNSKESRLTIVNYDLPKLNLSDWDYIMAKVDGDMNSRVLLRFWLTDGTGFDVAYWKEPYVISSTIFKLSSYYGRTFRGEAYIGLKSSDEMPSSTRIQEIYFIKIKGILMP